MSGIDALTREYERFVALPWDQTLAGPQKVWLAVYDPPQERQLRLRIPEFELATKNAGHSWRCLDLTDSFAQWMAGHKYRDAYFEKPNFMNLTAFSGHLTGQVRATLTAPDVDENTVIALAGLASLFGLTRVSALIEAVAPSIRGRLLGFFPGRKEGNNYRLLDARDGWNYLAVAITAAEGG